MNLYTDEVKKHIYAMKAKLPNDFPLQTREEFEDGWGFIVICVDMKLFGWRTVEDRLDIAVKLEKLRQLIEETGIRCVIEKD